MVCSHRRRCATASFVLYHLSYSNATGNSLDCPLLAFALCARHPMSA